MAMRRRAFIAALGGAVVSPLVARAQQADRVRRIGVVTGDKETDPEVQARVIAFRHRLAELGWAEGRNIWFDYRWTAADVDRIRPYVAELIGLNPDAILSMGTPVTVALQQQTRTIPIVFTLVADPVASRLQHFEPRQIF
jgi:putative ABC transport system substrate-binding protein